MESLFDEEKFSYEESKLFKVSDKEYVNWEDFTLEEKVMFTVAQGIRKLKRNGRENQIVSDFNAEDEDIVI